MQGCCTAFIQSCDDGAKKQRTVAVRCLQICLLDAAGFKKLVLAAPQLFGEIHEVGLRILETLDLIPQSINLTDAVLADVLNIRAVVNALAVLEQLYVQRTNRIIGNNTLLPGVDRMEQHIRQGSIDLLVVYGEHVAKCLAGLVVEQAVYLLEVRRGDLLDVLGNLDLRDDLAVFVLNGSQLIYAAEYRLGLGGDEPLADAERVDLRALYDEVAYQIFIERVGGHDLHIGETCVVEHLARLDREISDIARVQTDALGADAEAPLAAAMSGEQLFDRIADAYNENSGLLNDLMAPNAAGSQVNGWWTGYGLVKDCHCAYTVGSAVHYLTKTMDYLHQNGKPCPAKWMDAAQKVLHTVMDLQRADGAFGYTYSTQERKVLDWSGFAGCWFAPALVYLYRLTGEERCLHSAEKALDYYHTFVKDLNCYGTPMDTWKAVDEEGNLAFMRGSRLLYEQTGKAEFLQYMKDSAGYEFLWRYGYKTYPEHTPLNQGWSACGGAVTSVSNPHIHPMGVIIDTDLRYLARVTGDSYYASRAADSAAWMLQCLELYPAATGYGRYGILSERWCPSDGLDVERFSDGRPFSSWFSHNLWASACVLEAACELLLEIEHKKG